MSNTNTLVTVIVAGTTFTSRPFGKFSTESLGWNVSGKPVLTVGSAPTPLNVTVNGQAHIATPTKSGKGWTVSTRITVDGLVCQCGLNITAIKAESVPLNQTSTFQLGCNVTVIGTKPGSSTKAQATNAGKVPTPAPSVPSNGTVTAKGPIMPPTTPKAASNKQESHIAKPKAETQAEMEARVSRLIMSILNS